MKTILSALLAAAFCTAMACPAMAEDAAAPAVTAEKIAELVKQLGSDDFKAREGAQKELSKIGLPAKAELEKAVKGSDMEVKTRAGQLLVDIAQQEADGRSAAIAKKVMWSSAFKAGATGTPLLVGKVLFAVGDDAIHAIDAAQGKEVWSVPAKANAKFAVGGGVLAYLDEKKLVGVDVTTGKAKWQYEEFGTNQPVGVAADEAGVYATDSAGKLYAVSAADGKEQWKAEGLPGAQVPVCAGKFVLISGAKADPNVAAAAPGGAAAAIAIARVGMPGFGNTTIQAYNAAGGKIAWEYKSDLPVLSVVGGKDAAYLLTQSNLQAVGLAEGKQTWKYDLPEQIILGMQRMIVNGVMTVAQGGASDPILCGDNVYVMLPTQVVGVSASKGEKAVEAKIDPDAGQGGKGVIMNNGNVRIQMFNGGIRGQGTTGGGFAVEDDIAYFPKGASLMALDLKAAKTLWAVKLPTVASGQPVVRDGVLYVALGTQDAKVPANNMRGKMIVNGQIVETGGEEEKDAKDATELKLSPGVHAVKVK